MAYQQMTDAEVRAFLTADPPHTAVVGTVRADGRPHQAAVWYTLDSDGSILFNAGATSVKCRALTRDPRVSLCIDDERPPFSFVVVEGVASISDDLHEVRRWATVIGGRYMGADRAEEFGDRNGVPGEVLVRVRPERVRAAKNVADV
jgi:PPOX class probable F420-dependent enzyme